MPIGPAPFRPVNRPNHLFLFLALNRKSKAASRCTIICSRAALCRGPFMAERPLSEVVAYLRRISNGDTDGHTDAQLLERFVRLRDETAFAALVQRHGAMV